MALAFQPSSFDTSFDPRPEPGFQPGRIQHSFGRGTAGAQAMAPSGYPLHLVGSTSTSQTPVAAQIPAPIYEHPTVTRARSEAMFRRRRIGFAIAALVFVYGLWSLALGAVNIASADTGRLVGSSDSPATALVPTSDVATSLSVATQAGAAAIEPAPTYVVRSGDTLWSIAADLHVGGDLRVVVDQISALNDGAAGLQPGQRLVLPYYPEQ